jgi:hypothetical protein
MAIKAVVQPIGTGNIVVKPTGTAGVIQTNTPVTLRNIAATAPQRLDLCSDVDATSEVDGAVPVYDSATDKYVVQQINLDGGSF